MVDVKVVEFIGNVAMDIKLGPSCRSFTDAGDVTGFVDQIRGQVRQVTSERVVIVRATQRQVMSCQVLFSNATCDLLFQQAFI